MKKVRADLPLDVIETFEGNQSLKLTLKEEARTMAALNHPNIVFLMGVCVDPLCLIMELLDTSLYHKLRQAPLTWPQNLNIALDIARGMTYLHNQGIFRS